MSRGLCGWVFLLLAGGCGGEERAIEMGDPLHERGIRLPPVEVVLPPGPERREQQHFPVERPPPFSEGIFPCSRCHSGGKDEPVTTPSVAHQKHLDRDLECADCHGEGDPKIPDPESCLDCHETLEEEPAAVRAYFDKVRTDQETYAFPRSWRTRDTIASHPEHAAAKVACSGCHGGVSNAPFTKPRSVLLMDRCVTCHTKRGQSVECAACHEEIREKQHKDVVLRHAEDQGGCLDCHNPVDRDTLRLANGEKVPFEESYRLCGQCHGPNLRDWKAGLHGKRVGTWDGRKNYLLCVHCHRDPHQPAFPAMEPDPPPARPEDIR